MPGRVPGVDAVVEGGRVGVAELAHPSAARFARTSSTVATAGSAHRLCREYGIAPTCIIPNRAMVRTSYR
jgi:hypothetical protein